MKERIGGERCKDRERERERERVEREQEGETERDHAHSTIICIFFEGFTTLCT